MKLSVVVPTRNHPDTLEWTLRSCLDQAGAEVEVVVADNSDGGDTRQVVTSVGGGDRVRYVRPPRALAMSANWDFAVRQATGDYLTVLGDDDGLVPGALAGVARVIRESGATAVRWPWALYYWPTHPDHGLRDTLVVPAAGRMDAAGEWRCGRRDVQRALDARLYYNCLPMVYNSFVRRAAVHDLLTADGSLFPTRIPDIYSGLAVGSRGGQYVNLYRPVGVAGLSGGSNGVSQMAAKGPTDTATEFDRLNAGHGYAGEEAFPTLPVCTAYLAQTFLRFRQLQPAAAASYRWNPNRLLLAAAQELRWARLDLSYELAQYDRVLATATAGAVRRAVRRLAAACKAGVAGPIPLGVGENTIRVRASGLGVGNVYEAARLVGRLCGAESDDYLPPGLVPDEGGRAVVRRTAKYLLPPAALDIVRAVRRVV